MRGALEDGEKTKRPDVSSCSKNISVETSKNNDDNNNK